MAKPAAAAKDPIRENYFLYWDRTRRMFNGHGSLILLHQRIPWRNRGFLWLFKGEWRISGNLEQALGLRNPRFKTLKALMKHMEDHLEKEE